MLAPGGVGGVPQSRADHEGQGNDNNGESETMNQEMAAESKKKQKEKRKDMSNTPAAVILVLDSEPAVHPCELQALTWIR